MRAKSKSHDISRYISQYWYCTIYIYIHIHIYIYIYIYISHTIPKKAKKKPIKWIIQPASLEHLSTGLRTSSTSVPWKGNSSSPFLRRMTCWTSHWRSSRRSGEKDGMGWFLWWLWTCRKWIGSWIGSFPNFFFHSRFFLQSRKFHFFEANRFLVTYLSKYSIRNFMLMYMYARIMYHVACIC